MTRKQLVPYQQSLAHVDAAVALLSRLATKGAKIDIDLDSPLSSSRLALVLIGGIGKRGKGKGGCEHYAKYVERRLEEGVESFVFAARGLYSVGVAEKVAEQQVHRGSLTEIGRFCVQPEHELSQVPELVILLQKR